jgi:hypothetical protein
MHGGAGVEESGREWAWVGGCVRERELVGERERGREGERKRGREGERKTGRQGEGEGEGEVPGDGRRTKEEE